MSNNQPLVSVLMTNYNYASYLREALDSALNQTYPNLEIIVVDDGSTDHSREILATYQDRIIPVLKENSGQAAAVNSGFSIAQGDIICFLDSDDIWLPTKVEQVVTAFINAPGASVIYHKIQSIDGTGKLSGRPWPPYQTICGDISDQVVRSGGWWPWPPSTALSFTRRFLDQIMSIPEQEYRLFADAYPADLAPFFGEVVGLDEVLSYFRLHGANNWSSPIGRNERNLAELEIRSKVLNSVLQAKGIGVQIDLQDNMQYQHIRYKAGKSKDLMLLSKVMLKNLWEPRLHSRLKTVIELWAGEYLPGFNRT